MGKFQYSNEQLDINKVLKMDKDILESMLNDSEMNTIRREADNNITDSIALLQSMGMDKEVIELSKEMSEGRRTEEYKQTPKFETWEEKVARANIYEPNTVLIEDFVTEEEMQDSQDELNEINKQFSKKTSIINKTDLSFLAIATALQVTKTLVFPYVAEKFDYGKQFDSSQRLKHDDKSIKKEHEEANAKFKEKHKEKQEKGHWVNILEQTVPYDIAKGSKALGINLGGKYHRLYTLGHDPILGWFFGTANILTDCITFNSFQTNRISRVDPVTGKKDPFITGETVFMGTMVKECYDEVVGDYLNLPAAVFAQAQHLKSDEYTKVGLPVPILSCINEKFANKIYSENYDALCLARDTKIIGASFAISKIFDMIIALTHGLFKKENEDQNLYEVRTRKILLVSNSIASTSSIINTAITSNLKKLDIGSLLNTVIHLFTDLEFMQKVKQEFIENEISNQLESELQRIDEMYNRQFAIKR